MKSDINCVFQRLLRTGWKDEPKRLLSPNGTMWLSKDQPWVGSGSSFLEKMEGRVDRISRFLSNEVLEKHGEASEALNDTKSLVSCLQQIYGARERTNESLSIPVIEPTKDLFMAYQGHAIDLSPVFECAHRFSTSWNYESVRQALERLASSNSGAQIDWEKGGEEWGRVVVGNEVVAFVCAKLPIVAVHGKLSGIASAWAGNQDGAEVIVMDDFDAADFSADRSLLERIFGREISSHVDYNAISINELWWATI